MTTWTREMALRYVSFCVDDALSERRVDEVPHHARLVGWQCGFEPMFVAVWSYMGHRLDDDTAEELAIDLLMEKKWFSNEMSGTSADYVI
jgi:hypothetical protein